MISFVRPRMNTWKEIGILGLLVLAISVPFLGKPFHIDDTLFLYSASHILKDPLRPYNFNMNWYWTDQSMWSATQNPPANSYLLSFLLLLGGESEVAMHLYYMFFSLLSVFFFYLLCKEHLKYPLWPTLLFSVTPAFWLASNSVMADVPLLMFFMGSLYFFIQAQKRNSFLFLISSGLFMGFCGLTKYVGLSVIPLLLVHSLATKKRITRDVLVFSIPLVFFAAWCVHGAVFYGKPHFLSATQYSLFNQFFKNKILTQFVSTLIFLGGCSLFPIILAPAFDLLSGKDRSRSFIYWMVSIGAGVLFLALPLGGVAVFSNVDILLFLMFVIPTIRLMIWTFENIRSCFKLEHTVYLLWFAGMLVFCIFFNWTVASRVVLPAIPAWIFILFFIAERKFEKSFFPVKRAATISIVFVAAVSFLLAVSDQKLAETYETFAGRSADKYGRWTNDTVFTGHWGFQYYMEKAGFSPLRVDARKAPGMIIQPEIANYAPMPTQAHKYYAPVEEIKYFNPLRIHIMNDQRNAGFYANSDGILPFSISDSPIQVFRVYKKKG